MIKNASSLHKFDLPCWKYDALNVCASRASLSFAALEWCQCFIQLRYHQIVCMLFMFDPSALKQLLSTPRWLLQTAEFLSFCRPNLSLLHLPYFISSASGMFFSSGEKHKGVSRRRSWSDSINQSYITASTNQVIDMLPDCISPGRTNFWTPPCGNTWKDVQVSGAHVFQEVEVYHLEMICQYNRKSCIIRINQLANVQGDVGVQGWSPQAQEGANMQAWVVWSTESIFYGLLNAEFAICFACQVFTSQLTIQSLRNLLGLPSSEILWQSLHQGQEGGNNSWNIKQE